MSELKDHVTKENQWKTPLKGLDYDFEGPSAEYLLDAPPCFNQTVYQTVHAVKEEWSLADESQAQEYMPTRTEPIKLTLGIEEKKTTDIPTGHSIKLDEYFKFKKGYVINTGGSIWGLDFVPKSQDDTDPTTQYLAIAGYKGSVSENHDLGEIQPTGSYKNAIQIWKLRLSTKQASEDPLLDLCILHDFGVIHDLKWCPYGVYEDEDTNEGLPKLGILAIACGDGTIRIIVVPHPNAVRKYMCPEDQDYQKTVYLNIESSRCLFTLGTTKTLVLAWGGHKKIAAGYTSGVVSIWDVESSLNGDEANIAEKSKKYMTLSLKPLDAGARCLSWQGHSNPERLLVGGYDGKLLLMDENDPFVQLPVHRARSIMNACAWPGHSHMMLYSDGENLARGSSFNIDGSLSMAKHTDLPGLCWSMAASEFHGQFAMSTATGYIESANMYQAKARALKNSVNIVHRLFYNEDTNEYRYIDGIGLINMPQAKTIPSYRVYGKTHMAIQRVVWSSNRPTCGFLASGGSAGLCRIEFEGRGSGWI